MSGEAGGTGASVARTEPWSRRAPRPTCACCWGAACAEGGAGPRGALLPPCCWSSALTGRRCARMARWGRCATKACAVADTAAILSRPRVGRASWVPSACCSGCRVFGCAIRAARTTKIGLGRRARGPCVMPLQRLAHPRSGCVPRHLLHPYPSPCPSLHSCCTVLLWECTCTQPRRAWHGRRAANLSSPRTPGPAKLSALQPPLPLISLMLSSSVLHDSYTAAARPLLLCAEGALMPRGCRGGDGGSRGRPAEELMQYRQEQGRAAARHEACSTA